LRGPVLSLKPSTRYRHGERTRHARAEHTRQSREWRRDLADAAFPLALRQKFLRLLWRDGSLPAAAARVDQTVMAIYGRMRWDSEFAELVERALTRLCRDNPRCGQAMGYKLGGRCRQCRNAKRQGRPSPAA
jgi:hypothetical protein